MSVLFRQLLFFSILGFVRKNKISQFGGMIGEENPQKSD
jgi:hypothetical protein